MNMPAFFRSALLAIAAVLVVAAPASAAGGQVIVKFAPGKARTSAMPPGARLGDTIHALGARVVRTTGDPAAAAAGLDRRADVEYAEVDRPMQLFATPNGRGVTGVAFNSPLSICKALSGPLGQGTTADVASCITWETDRGAKVISMSLGGGPSTTLQNAVRYAASHDVLIVAAAGNDGNATLNYPAAYAEVVSVAATDARDVRASFSNANSDVEIAAPGVNILSTYNDGGYRVLSGTSMATPHVSGVGAVIRTRHPTFTAAQARAKLDASVDDKGPAGRDTQYGFGRVNLAKAAT